MFDSTPVQEKVQEKIVLFIKSLMFYFLWQESWNVGLQKETELIHWMNEVTSVQFLYDPLLNID